MIQLERSYHFYAAHRNPDAGEKCGRIHGHTYHVICTFELAVKKNGLSIQFEQIDKAVEPIAKKFDHYFMVWDKDPIARVLRENNETIYTVPFPTSAENVAQHLFDSIFYLALNLVKLQLKETESSNIIITSKSK